MALRMKHKVVLNILVHHNLPVNLQLVVGPDNKIEKKLHHIFTGSFDLL